MGQSQSHGSEVRESGSSQLQRSESNNVRADHLKYTRGGESDQSQLVSDEDREKAQQN